MKIASWPGPSAPLGNPFVRLWAEALTAEGATVVDFVPGAPPRCDIVHAHWPEWVLDGPRGPKALRRRARVLNGLRKVRARGGRVVWTAHNLGAHDIDGRRGSQLAWRAFSRQVDGYISLTASGVDQVRARMPALRDVPAFVIPHGHYRGAYPNVVSRAEARASLGVPDAAHVALFLGQVRGYKNVPELVRVFQATEGTEGAEDQERLLLIAGRPGNDKLRREVEAKAHGDARVRLQLDFIPVDDVQRYMNASDVVVLPYRETFNSGAALLALSFDRPVLAPAVGAFLDLEQRLGRTWVRTYVGELTATTLAAALAAGAPGGPAPLDDFAWSTIARQTLGAYQNLRQ